MISAICGLPVSMASHSSPIEVLGILGQHSQFLAAGAPASHVRGPPRLHQEETDQHGLRDEMSWVPVTSQDSLQTSSSWHWTVTASCGQTVRWLAWCAADGTCVQCVPAACYPHCADFSGSTVYWSDHVQHVKMRLTLVMENSKLHLLKLLLPTWNQHQTLTDFNFCHICCAQLRARAHAHTHTHTHEKHTYAYTHANKHVHACIRTSTHAHVHVHTRTCITTHAHTHTSTNTLKHTHSEENNFSESLAPK